MDKKVIYISLCLITGYNVLSRSLTETDIHVKHSLIWPRAIQVSHSVFPVLLKARSCLKHTFAEVTTWLTLINIEFYSLINTIKHRYITTITYVNTHRHKMPKRKRQSNYMNDHISYGNFYLLQKKRTLIQYSSPHLSRTTSDLK
jgi:hypothetical protein